jgi:hypothetical protein
VAGFLLGWVSAWLDFCVAGFLLGWAVLAKTHSLG